MIVLILIILGLCLGSFVNAWVWRLHEQSKPKSKRVAKDRDLSITKGRSMCPDCKHTLAGKDLMPVLSWLSLGGKCRYCKKPISWQYPIVELLIATLFIVAYQVSRTILQEQGVQFVAFGVFLAAIVVGVALAVYDFKWMLLPTRLVYIFGGFAAAYALLQLADGRWNIFGIVGAVLVSGGLFWVLFQVSAGKWIGGGDVRLGFALGLLLGSLDQALLMLFLASLLGVFYACILMVIRKYKKGVHIPFGPFLLMATYFVFLFGTQITTYYENLILP